MGNAAAMPISAKECEKYGITMDDVHGYNKVVKETKKKKKGKKLDKRDLDKIHKYCQETSSKSGKNKGLHKLLETKLSASVTDQSVTQASSTFDDESILEFVPAMIQLEDEDETSVLASVAEGPTSAEA
ncbi:expressed unknown protein [Seminavis robusta]|uniref:Uncharacterized protein n=1 Tax=Seminavis robusta TaxID=568900 RepID=A0A9N8DIG8_9STRA|nr:expressed unknown protein [Seminavis robusta]|eukprot:Sro160_g072250.1 n/a (129) ;mRNA; r:73797-74183